MTAVIKAVGFANGQFCPHGGQWLSSFDREAFNGQGHATFTSDPDLALRFPSFGEAFAFWNQQSKSRPTRADGKPNKPLTALTVEIETLL